MEVSKDIYEYLMNFADDRTILNMLSVNKEFRDEKFFKRVMERKYPAALKFKSPGQSWKQYYIETVYYVEKIYELIGYRYSNNAKRSPETYYRSISRDNLDYILILAIRDEDLDFVKFLIEEKGLNINQGRGTPLWAASEKGNLDMVKYLVEHGAVVTINDGATYEAARYGYLDILKYLVEKGAGINLNLSLGVAEKYGHSEVVKYLKSL
jgi:hypothetical protein